MRCFVFSGDHFFTSQNVFKFAMLLIMIFTDSGIVLFRQEFREADRIISLYTRHHGRIHLRVPGVSRPTGKLKALSEIFTHADYRVYVKRGGTLGTVTGGKLQRVFPNIRQNLKKTSLALHFCELFQRLTPLHQPSEEKFELLLSALTELEYAEQNTAFAAAFTLRLMMLAGFGLDHPVLKINPEFWRRMHEDRFSSLLFTKEKDLIDLEKCNNVCRRFLTQSLSYPLHTLKNMGLDEIAQNHSEAPLSFTPVATH